MVVRTVRADRDTDPDIADIAALEPSDGSMLYWASGGTRYNTTASTSYMRGLLNTASEAALKAAINAEAGVDFVAYNGALGTPSSGVLTNATGLPISTGVAGLGTGVATALAVNVGSAGAPVVNGGAGGTPSSLTLTNATGLPVATGISGLGTDWSGRLTAGAEWAALRSGDDTADAQAIIDSGKNLMILPECDGISLAGIVVTTGTRIWAPRPIRIVANNSLFLIGTSGPATTDVDIDLGNSLVDMRTATDPASSVYTYRTSLGTQAACKIKNTYSLNAFAMVKQDADSAQNTFTSHHENLVATICRGAPFRLYNSQGFMFFDDCLADFTDGCVWRGTDFLPAGISVAKSFFGFDFGGTTRSIGMTIRDCSTFGKGVSGTSGSPGGMKLRNFTTPIIKGFLSDSCYGIGFDWEDVDNPEVESASGYGAAAGQWLLDDVNDGTWGMMRATGTGSDDANTDAVIMRNCLRNQINAHVFGAKRRNLSLEGGNVGNLINILSSFAGASGIYLDNTTLGNSYNSIFGHSQNNTTYGVESAGSAGTPSCMIAAMLVSNGSGNYTGLETLERVFGYNNAGDLFASMVWV